MKKKNKRIVENWMDDEQIDIIQNENFVWNKQRFKATDGYWVKSKDARILGKVEDGKDLPEGAVIEKQRWDHEHCRMCWEKIAEFEGCQHEGYTNGRDWLCESCFNKYLSE
jgi:hypothetical protein